MIASFEVSGVRVRSGTGAVWLELVGVGRGLRLSALRRAGPTASGNVVRYERPGLSEWYGNGPLGLEQGFTIARRPSGSGGRLTLAIRTGGSLTARRVGSAVGFVSRSGAMALRYGALAAVDASGRRLPATFTVQATRVLVQVADRRARYPVRIDPLIQQGQKLVGNCTTGCGGPNGTGESFNAEFGYSVALSADGDTALVGAPFDNTTAGNSGAAWVFVRSGGVWSQQGSKLINYCTSGCVGPNGSGAVGAGSFGQSVALSADGNTALIGAPADNGFMGAAWVFVRSGASWSQQGTKFVGNCSSACSGQSGSGEVGSGELGWSVALSPDASTAVIGAPYDNSLNGAAWAFTRSNAGWSSTKLIGDCASGCGGPRGTGEIGAGLFGWSVALSQDGGTALIGAVDDGGSPFVSFPGQDGGAWVFVRSGLSWSQQGSKLIGDCPSGCGGANGVGESGHGGFGESVALSADGSSALIGAAGDSGNVGAAWVFTRSAGAWGQQGAKLIGDCSGSCTGPDGTGESGAGQFGHSVALSSDGSIALIGVPDDNGSLGEAGAAFVFARLGGAWSQQGAKLLGSCTSGCGGPSGSGETSPDQFGFGVAMSADGNTGLLGAPSDSGTGSNGIGGVWVFTQPTTCADVDASTPAGGGGVSVSLSCAGPTGSAPADGLAAPQLTYAIVTPPAHGSLGPIDQSIGSVAYASQPGYVGSDTFTYEATDRVGNSATATVTITVRPAPPACATIASRTPAGGGSVSVSFSCQAPAGVALTYAIVAAPAHGTLSPVNQGLGTVTYTSTPGYHGSDSFSYLATDSGGPSAAAVVSLTVPPAPPVCANLSSSTPASGHGITVLLACTAPPGVVIRYATVSAPSHGTIGAINQSSGSVSYTPRPSYIGTDRFTYRASDAGGVSNTARATITVPRAVSRINSTIRYRDVAFPSYTTITSIVVSDVPPRATVRVACSGKGCAFKSRIASANAVEGSKRKGTRCSTTGRRHRSRCANRTVDLSRLFLSTHLGVGTRVTVSVVEPGAVGKVFIVTMQPAQDPTLKITCIAPGSSTPGQAC